VPFDGIGIQAHEPRTMRFPLDRARDILDQYAALGKDLYITEFSPTSGGEPITGSPVSGKWDEKAQEDYAVKFYRVCFAHPAVKGITWWDLCDQGSWLPGGGMLRKDLSPKPVHEALRKLIREEWHTRAEGRTDSSGRFAFTGFFGRYKVMAAAGGKTAATEWTLPRGGEPAEMTIRMK
jgi:endo-1,4-beta-xylanase